MVSQETRIAWSDTRNMHCFHIRGGRKGSNWIPAFAFSDAQLRHVIAQAAWQHMHKSRFEPLPPALIEDRVILEQMCIASDKKHIEKAYGTRYGRKPGDDTDCMWIRHVGSIELAGSYLSLISTIAYRSWRAGQASNAIAEQMGLTPVGVRQHLYRLVRIARKLGYEAHKKPHHRLGAHGIRTPHRVKLPPGPQLVKEVEADGYKAVCSRYDVLRISVYKAYGIAKGYTDDLGHPLAKRPPRKKIYTPELIAQVEKLRAKGLTYPAIASKLKLNRGSLLYRVYQDKKRATVKVPAVALGLAEQAVCVPDFPDGSSAKASSVTCSK